WHVASAPASPPRFPVTLVALDTKNVIPVCVVGLVTRSSSPHAGVRSIRARNSFRLIGLSPFRPYLTDLLTTDHTMERLNHAKLELDRRTQFPSATTLRHLTGTGGGEILSRGWGCQPLKGLNHVDCSQNAGQGASRPLLESPPGCPRTQKCAGRRRLGRRDCVFQLFPLLQQRAVYRPLLRQPDQEARSGRGVSKRGVEPGQPMLASGRASLERCSWQFHRTPESANATVATTLRLSTYLRSIRPVP